MLVILRLDHKDLETLKEVIDEHRYEKKWENIAKAHNEATKAYGKLLLAKTLK